MCRRVPRIVLAAKNKIPPGSGDYVPKKEEPGETLALVCAGGGWDEREVGRDDGTMIRTRRREKERKRHQEKEGGEKKESEKERGRRGTPSWWIMHWGLS